MENTNHNRVKGVLFGLAAGDRNGGPIRMSLRLAESLIDNKSFDRLDIATRYYNWYLGPPHEAERAFDTGSTFAAVFSFVKKNGGKITNEIIDSSSQAALKAFQSAGVNAAHRAAPLAMAKFIKEEDLEAIVKLESSITHMHNLSFEVALATVIIIRHLIEGYTWIESMEYATKYRQWSMEVKSALESRPSTISINDLDNGGFAPHVLQSSLYFIHTTQSFSDAVNQSVKFAGPANYCPVLTGAFAGGLYGYSAISMQDMKHCDSKLITRLTEDVKALSSSWSL